MRTVIFDRQSRLRPAGVACLAMLLMCGCATAPLTESGMLSSYAGLTPSDGMLTQTRLRVDRAAVTTARTVSIAPTGISSSARQSGLTEEQLRLVANAMDRALCAGLGERFEVKTLDQPADIRVNAIVTHIGTTDVTSAGVSNVVNIGSTVAGAVTGIPIPSARIPLGMGGLSVEAEAMTPQRQQIAAITWARGADSLTTKARLSEEADAYQLGKEFAADFSKLLVTGTDPIKDQVPDLPSSQKINEYFGGKPKFAACEQFGRNPGLGDTLGGAVGLPPDWTDSGSK